MFFRIASIFKAETTTSSRPKLPFDIKNPPAPDFLAGCGLMLSTGQKCSRTSKSPDTLEERSRLRLWGCQNCSGADLVRSGIDSSVADHGIFCGAASLDATCPSLLDKPCHPNAWASRLIGRCTQVGSVRWILSRLYPRNLRVAKSVSTYQRFNLPAFSVKAGGLRRINPKGGQDQELVLCGSHPAAGGPLCI